jgi:SRSO17 transposase
LIADDRTWPLTFEVYLPASWMADALRRTAVGIPDALRFRVKWRMALAQVRTVLKAGFTLTGVLVDADYGSNAAFRDGLERLGLRYAVAIRGGLTFWTPGARRTHTATGIAAATRPTQWTTVTWGTGTTRALVASFYAVRVRPTKGRGERWLLCERSADAGPKYYLLNLAPTVALHDLVAMARARWPIEQQYRELKDELGLDHFEGRSYRGWNHHVVMTAIAFTFLQLERPRADPRPTLPVVRDWIREIMGLLYVIHNRQLLRTLHSFERNPPLRR